VTLLKALDYDTGDFSQWSTQQLRWGYSGQLVTDLRRKESGYAARFEVRPGDDPIGDGHERAELTTATADINGYEGGEVFIGASVYFPDGALNPTLGVNKTNIFLQVHEVSPSQPVPPVRISVDASGAYPYTLKAFVAGQGYPTIGATVFDIGAPRWNDWNDFVIRAIWSDNPAIGLFQMWRDGVEVVPAFHKATKYTGQDCYFKQGYYRTNQSLTSVIYHDECRVADNYQDAKAPPRVPPLQGAVVRVPDGAGGFDQVFRHQPAA
jgi:hypothetical protein